MSTVSGGSFLWGLGKRFVAVRVPLLCSLGYLHLIRHSLGVLFFGESFRSRLGVSAVVSIRVRESLWPVRQSWRGYHYYVTRWGVSTELGVSVLALVGFLVAFSHPTTSNCPVLRSRIVVFVGAKCDIQGVPHEASTLCSGIRPWSREEEDWRCLGEFLCRVHLDRDGEMNCRNAFQR